MFKICQNTITACNGEFVAICTLPAAHGGVCNFVETMGLRAAVVIGNRSLSPMGKNVL